MKEEDLTKVLNSKADNSQNEENEAKKKAVAKGNVTVCCGIPMGIRLVRHNGAVVELKGVPMSHIVSANKGEGFLPAGKFGTTILPASIWEELAEKYKNFDFMLNGTIFAEEVYEKAAEKAKVKSEQKLGFEQADPKKSRTKKANSGE